MIQLILGIVIGLGAGASPVLLETEHLSTAGEFLAVDARNEDAFLAGHIPGAAHVDVDSLSEERDGVPNVLKAEKALVALFASAGLAPEKTLVVYSDLNEASDVKRATRLFWALECGGYTKVRFLNGGLSKWKAEGRPLETGASTVAPLGVEALAGLDFNGERYATRDEVLEAQSTKKGIIADLRPSDNFTGESKKDFVARSGHIAGAKSQPAPSFVEGEHFTFKGPEVIQKLLADSKGQTSASVVTYCNTGRDATVGYVAYRIAGFEDVAVYDGSMAEWGNTEACPMSTGADE